MCRWPTSSIYYAKWPSLSLSIHPSMAIYPSLSHWFALRKRDFVRWNQKLALCCNRTQPANQYGFECAIGNELRLIRTFFFLIFSFCQSIYECVFSPLLTYVLHVLVNGYNGRCDGRWSGELPHISAVWTTDETAMSVFRQTNIFLAKNFHPFDAWSRAI